MADETQGISNRETAREEAEEREELARPPEIARDGAGHLHTPDGPVEKAEPTGEGGGEEDDAA